MPVFTMPQLGESDVEGTVLRWLKQPGEHVQAEEPLVEVETEKVTVEIPSPFEGTLTEVLVGEGETAPVGAELAVIGAREAAQTPAAMPPVAIAADRGTPAPSAPLAADAPAAARAPALAAEPTGPMVAAVAAREDGGRYDARPPVSAPPPGAGDKPHGVDGGSAGAGHTRYSPAVLRLAAEHGIDLKAVPGTGMEGRITRKDVMQFLERGAGSEEPGTGSGERGAWDAERADAEASPARAVMAPPATDGPATPDLRIKPPVASPTAPDTRRPAPDTRRPAPDTRPAAPAPRDDEEIIRPSPTRLTIARNMLRSAQSIPTAWMVVEMDVTALVKLRERIKEEFRRREGVDLSYLPFIITALAGALKEHPHLNSEWRDDHIVLKKRINLGVAVGSDEGLIVPVIHDADRLSLTGLAHSLVDLATRARARKLRLEDVQGGTFTLDNTGVFGSLVSQPIINPPQCAILSTEAIIKRPAIIEDAIAIRSLMNMCIAFDHRIVDGSQVGPFMQSIKRRLEGFGPETPIA